MNRFITAFVFIILVSLFMGCDPDTNDSVVPVPSDEDNVSVLNDIFKGEPIVVVFHNEFNIFTAYSRRLADGTILEFKNDKPSGVIELEDTEGNKWNYAGKAVSGTRTGSMLKEIRMIKGLWLAISSFYPKATLFNNNEEDRIEYENPTPDWLIHPDLIQQSTGQDVIPALTYPEVSELRIKNSTQPGEFTLSEEDEVIIVEHNNVVKVYPIRIMNWHEVVNDTIGGLPVTIAHSPLTATTTVFRSDGSGEKLAFGVSGKLHNNNLILYDKQTNSLWSQIKNQCINGPLIGQEPTSLPFLETNYKYVEEALLGRQNLFAMNYNTGHSFEYDIFPYGTYRTNNLINYPLTYTDDRIPTKEVVLAIIVDNEAKVYRSADFN